MVVGRGRNELKILVLNFLVDHGESTAQDISLGIGEELHNVSNALLRCKRGQLVKRRKDYFRKGYHTFGYSITQKGRDRLDYYRTKDQAPPTQAA